jgi:enterochelin esterase family protein
MKLIWLAAGDEDFALAGNRGLDELFTTLGVTHSFTVTRGRHEWRIWREHLNTFAPLLFR